ncbi:hypothetical protein MPTK1_8g16700 [Marchantia polymorpha subsp. ruderalis]|nr:hypothetical protein Mp_8g16700 [Marchantia polymorpha subsp. ruderalis]
MDMNKGKGEAAGKGVEELAMKILKKLIEPIHKDKLLDILQHAASRHIYVLEDIRKPADKYHKIFVSGLCPDSTLETLHDVFSPFGEFEEAEFPVDKRTGQSRGFAFITFKHMECAKRALKEHSKISKN